MHGCSPNPLIVNSSEGHLDELRQYKIKRTGKSPSFNLKELVFLDQYLISHLLPKYPPSTEIFTFLFHHFNLSSFQISKHKKPGYDQPQNHNIKTLMKKPILHLDGFYKGNWIRIRNTLQ